MKKSRIVEVIFVGAAAIGGLVAYIVFSKQPNLDDKLQWTDVLVSNVLPERKVGKYHTYFIDYTDWKCYRKEKGQWKYKGDIYELANAKTTKKDYKTSQEVFSVYKSTVEITLKYAYMGSGAEWLQDLAQLRLYKRQIYQINFVDYDGTFLWKTNAHLRENLVYEGEIPQREGYVFQKWDTSLDNITSSLTVKPIYKKI